MSERGRLIAVLARELALAYEAGDLGAARVTHRAIGALIGDDSRGGAGLVTPDPLLAVHVTDGTEDQ